MFFELSKITSRNYFVLSFFKVQYLVEVEKTIC